MKIAVVGAGGAGGYFGGLLAQAGYDVTFVARGEHLRAMQARGLRVQSVHGDFHILPAQGADRPAEVGAVDLTIFTVKTYDTESAADPMRPLVGSQTAILPLQNGVESASRLRAYFRESAILGGAAWVVAYMAEPGLIWQESRFRRIVFGELDGRETERVRAIHGALRQAGITAETTAQIEKVLWTKLMFIASFSGITSVTRAPAGPVLACAESRMLLRRAMLEVEAVARAKGIPLHD